PLGWLPLAMDEPFDNLSFQAVQTRDLGDQRMRFSHTSSRPSTSRTTDPAAHGRAHQPASDATIASWWTRRSIVAPPSIGLLSRPTTANRAGRTRTGRDSS